MKRMIILGLAAAFGLTGWTACRSSRGGAGGAVKLITLDPGHFHAALVQKTMPPGAEATVHVYAPAGDEVDAHLARIEGFNTRKDDPTSWTSVVHRGPDFLERMLAEKKGNVMVTAGNNRRKIDYILASVDAGLNVLADKPMAINAGGFEKLRRAYASAEKNRVFLYDIMTERYEITTMLQREFAHIPAVFGKFKPGTPDDPAVTKESVHYFSKIVSGSQLIRPPWFFDVEQQGEGIVDVTTHLVDLVQWGCFPEVPLDYTKDVEMISARRWPTVMTPEQFTAVTGKAPWPEYLKKDVKDGALHVYANGEMIYRLKGLCSKVSVTWGYEAEPGTGDTHASVMRGTRASLIIRQGPEQKFKPTLYIEPSGPSGAADLDKALTAALPRVTSNYPGVGIKKSGAGWEVLIPDHYKTGHEAHFSEVAAKYFRFLRDGRMPEWEVPNTICKYYTTTKALEMAKAAR